MGPGPRRGANRSCGPGGRRGSGVGFATADELALKLGLSRESPFRAQAAVRHVLSEATGDGHVGFPEEQLREKAVALSQIPPAGIIDAIEQLRITDEVVQDSVQRAGSRVGGRGLPFRILLHILPLTPAPLPHDNGRMAGLLR